MDEQILESEDFKKMQASLNQVFYFEEDYQTLVEKAHLNSKLMDPYVIRRLGYKSYAGYILKEPNTPGKYFETWILAHSKDIDPRYFNLSSFVSTMDRLEKQLELFEWEKNVYLPLSSLHISKKELQDFVKKIVSTVQEGQYFTQTYLSQKRL